MTIGPIPNEMIEPKLIPIEVKLNETKSKSLELFMQKFKAKKGFILTQNQEKREKKEIEVIPIFNYFLTVNKK